LRQPPIVTAEDTWGSWDEAPRSTKVPPGHLVAFVPSGWGTSIDVPGVDAMYATPAGTYVEGPKHSIETLAARGRDVRILEDATRVGRGATFRDYRQADGVSPPERLEWQGRAATYPFLVKTFGGDFGGVLATMAGGTANPIGDSAYLIEVPVAQLAEIEAISFVAWVEPYHYAYRLDPWLAAVLAGEATPISEPLSFRVVALPSVSAERLRADVAVTHAAVLAGFATMEGESLIVHGTIADLRLIHRLEVVAWIEPGALQPCTC